MAEARKDALKLAVIGDVHGHWTPDSVKALQFLEPDAVVVLGDIGEENVSLTKSIARAPLPLHAILGNHDAWYSLTDRSRERYAQLQARSMLAGMRGGADAEEDDDWAPGVDQQLDSLRHKHIGFGAALTAGGKLVVVGARPFSRGGGMTAGEGPFYLRHYGIKTEAQSAELITSTVLAARQAHPGIPMVLAAHSGPSGLGSAPSDICGVDWREEGGDHGDPDLKKALGVLEEQGACPRVVLFGHMHDRIKWDCVDRGDETGLRNRAVVKGKTLFLNAAVVPRVRYPYAGGAVSQHHCLMLSLARSGACVAADDTWVEIAPGLPPRINLNAPLARAVQREDGTPALCVFHANTGTWEQVVYPD